MSVEAFKREIRELSAVGRALVTALPPAIVDRLGAARPFF
jgi:hypothetical protein